MVALAYKRIRASEAATSCIGTLLLPPTLLHCKYVIPL